MTPAEKFRIGTRLKAERTARGWKQREFAEMIAEAMGEQLTTDIVTLTDYVKRWERGRTGFSPRYRQALADVLGIPQRQLFDPGDGEDDPVERRQFLGVTTAAVGLTVSPWTPVGHPEAQQRRRIGADVVAQLKRRTVRLRRLDDVLGGADTYRLYASELSATRNLTAAATYSETTGRALLAVVAEQAQQAGWAALDAGQMTAARALYRESMTAAAEAGNSSLLGNALALMSYQRVTAGQRGTDEADAACRVVGPETPSAVRALLHERAAWAHAMAGQSHTRQVEESLGAATKALAGNVGEEGHDPDWARWVDDVELQIMTGRCWTILRRPDRAVPALKWALERFDDTYARDKSLYLSWLAEAHIEELDFDAAAQALSRSIDLGVDIASARPRKRVQVVVARLRPHASAAAVRDVMEQARTMWPPHV
ncbi:helix-turn-helix domain-containing protein [Actinomadura formosensis]|uniref:helix-turn-helix domain-containing protein n=1 Tax=Actinomadura formosensis TaxID=60706 RepID=UPI003D8A0E27